MTGAEAQSAGFRQLRAAGVPDPATDSRRLLAVAAGVPRDRLTLINEEVLGNEAAVAYQTAIDRRAKREPVSHISGTREFYGRQFAVGPEVLDPRPETETLIEIALREPFRTVLDLGTGSGCILLTLLAERPGTWGVGIEKSCAAWRVAADNRDALGLSGPAVLRVGDWYDGAETTVSTDFAGFDLIVSNPPYIAAAEMAGLEPEVRDHEPRMALTDGADGLSAFRVIAAGAGGHLTPGGRLIVEIGPTQAEKVRQIFATAGLTNITVHSDLDGRNRVVAARKPG